MPELPSVERTRQRLEEYAVGRRILGMNWIDDPLVFPPVDLQRWPDQVVLSHIDWSCYRASGTGRYGKYFWLRLQSAETVEAAAALPDMLLLMHLGMTGKVHIQGAETIVYQTDPLKLKTHRHYADAQADAFPPKHYKWIMTLTEQAGEPDAATPSVRIALADPRRLARVRLVKQRVGVDMPVPNLGWDPILSWPPMEEFAAALARRAATIKSILLDQSVCAGVGNWIADEVLYQARIHPARMASSLSPAEVRALHHQVAHVCRVAVDAQADSTRFPADWLFHVRWDKAGAKRAAHVAPMDAHGHSVVFETVGGRTSAIVPALQKKSGYISWESGAPSKRQRRR